MEKVMERLEGLARVLVPIAYMLGLIGGTVFYFTDGAGNLKQFLLDVGGALAVATELHSFLLQRRVLVAWTQLRKADNAADEEEAWRDLKMYGGWLAALLAFQVFTSIMYRAALYHPSDVGTWMQTGVSGVVVPVFFFGVGFLANVVNDPKDVQAETQRETAMQSARAGQQVAYRALKAAKRSFQWRLRQAEKAHADLTGLAVAMQRRFGDDDGAQTLMVIDDELRSVEGQAPRKYAGVWHDPDAAQKAVKAPAQPTPAPRIAAAAPAHGGLLPDVASMSDEELVAYARRLRAAPSAQGEALDQRIAALEQVAAEMARRPVFTSPAEPGRRRFEGDVEQRWDDLLGLAEEV